MSKKKRPLKRIEFLAKKFDVFDDKDIQTLVDNDFYSGNVKYESLYDVSGDTNIIYSIYSFNKRKLTNEGVKVPNNVRVADFVFINIVQADPTEHKEYVQWMLETFTRLIKVSDFDRALMFVREDLWMASEYLSIFHEQKHKPTFKALCKNNKAFKGISDPSNINQYRDLSHLFDAVDPYIDKDSSELEKQIRVMTRLKLGVIPYEDRKVMVFTPLKVKASRLFRNLTNWCTTGSKTSYNQYVNKKTPYGGKSKLYIVIPKTYFLPDGDPNRTDELFQFHFESEMYMDKKDSRIPNISKIVEGNVGLQKFFYDTLYNLAVKDTDKKYINVLYKFGFTEILFDILPKNVKAIKYIDYNIDYLPNLSKFKELNWLYLYNVGLKDVNSSIVGLDKLKILSLPNNKLKKIPKYFGKLKNLEFLNLVENEIIEIPEEISGLDKSKGGSLKFISVNRHLYDKVKKLLPNVEVNSYDR